MKLINYFRSNALSISMTMFLVTGSLAVGNRYYLDFKYPRDEYGLPIGCKCYHCGGEMRQSKD